MLGPTRLRNRDPAALGLLIGAERGGHGSPSARLETIADVAAVTQDGGSGQSARQHAGKAFRTDLREQVLGWGGAFALLLAFGLDAAGFLSASAPASLLLNLLGALGLAYASLVRRAYPPAVLNLVWASVAALSLLLLIGHL